MKVNNCKGYNQNFGNLYCTGSAVRYLNRTLKPEKIEKILQIMEEQKGKKPDVFLNTGKLTSWQTGKETPYLVANVDKTYFREGLFTSALGVIKKAVKYANSLSKQG